MARLFNVQLMKNGPIMCVPFILAYTLSF